MTVLAIVVLLAVLSVSVLVHELAHYLNAKSVGLEVRAFSVGMGPVLWKRHWRGTEWRISILPLGGYVDLPGMAAEVDDEERLQHPSSGFATKSLAAKLWVLVGGVLANIVLGIILIALVISSTPEYRVYTTPDAIQGAAIAQVQPGSFADELGLQADDVIHSINGIAQPDILTVQQQIQQAEGLELVLMRQGVTRTVTRDWPPANQPALLGIGLRPAQIESIGFVPALLEASRFVTTALPNLFQGYGSAIGQTMSGQRSEDVVGPVGIWGLFKSALQQGVVPLLWLMAIINISLAVFNLLPIPGLDGGRMLIATLLAIRGKPLKPGQEEMLHLIGFAFVMLFALLLTVGEVGDLLRR